MALEQRSHPSIESERLELVLLERRIMQALLGGRLDEAAAALGAALPDGWPDDEERWLLALRLGQAEADPASAPWLLRAVVLRAERAMVGHVGFHGPPDARGRVEIGYSIFEPWRRCGYAYEAALALAGWARGRPEARVLVASVAPANAPSLALVRKAGMRQTGRQWDDVDGEELVFELPLAGLPEAP
jgi:[ribosomal protein S5]-alanine N-acetyltransferase